MHSPRGPRASPYEAPVEDRGAFARANDPETSRPRAGLRRGPYTCLRGTSDVRTRRDAQRNAEPNGRTSPFSTSLPARTASTAGRRSSRASRLRARRSSSMGPR